MIFKIAIYVVGFFCGAGLMSLLTMGKVSDLYVELSQKEVAKGSDTE